MPMIPSLSEIVRKADKAGACQSQLKIVKSFSTWEQALTHPCAPQWALWYAIHVLKNRFPAAEPVISTCPSTAYCYAKDVIHSRWIEAEPTISTSPDWAVWYAQIVLKSRWPEAEPTILADPESAYWYARNIIRGRWPDAESTIAKDPRWKTAYHIFITTDHPSRHRSRSRNLPVTH